MVYLHPPNEAPQTDEFTRFLEAIGVRAIHHNLTFWDTVAASPFGTHSPVKMGSYCRLDLPQLVTGELNAELRGRALPTDRILYTDTDVIIGADVRFPVDQPLRTLAAADEGFGTVGSLNSGVLLMHTSFMVSEFPHFLDYGKRHKFHFQVHDQSWMDMYYRDSNRGLATRLGGFDNSTALPATRRWHLLDRAIYNGRPFEHPLGNTTTTSEVVLPSIWHWQGFKPPDVACWAQAMETGRFPWRHDDLLRHPAVTGCPKHDARWPFRWRRCSLHTYARLYGQHLLLLALSRQIGLKVEDGRPVRLTRAVHAFVESEAALNGTILV